MKNLAKKLEKYFLKNLISTLDFLKFFVSKICKNVRLFIEKSHWWYKRPLLFAENINPQKPRPPSLVAVAVAVAVTVVGVGVAVAAGLGSLVPAFFRRRRLRLFSLFSFFSFATFFAGIVRYIRVRDGGHNLHPFLTQFELDLSLLSPSTTFGQFSTVHFIARISPHNSRWLRSLFITLARFSGANKTGRAGGGFHFALSPISLLFLRILTTAGKKEKVEKLLNSRVLDFLVYMISRNETDISFVRYVAKYKYPGYERSGGGFMFQCTLQRRPFHRWSMEAGHSGLNSPIRCTKQLGNWEKSSCKYQLTVLVSFF